MPTNQEKQEIRRLAKNGKSVNHITKKLGLPKSTVYYHFRKQVGQKQKENSLSVPKDPETIGEICGTFAGDGNFYKRKAGHYQIRIFLNIGDDYWKALSQFLEENLSKKPNIYKYPDKGLVVLNYSSKDLYKMLKSNLDWGEDKTESIRLKSGKVFSEEFKKGFVRGLIDTDGHKERKFRRYIYGTISESLRDDFSSCLDDLDIEHTNYRELAEKDHWRTMHKTRITGDMAEIFSKEIDPRHPKKRYLQAK